jgi:hypothetical protein
LLILVFLSLSLSLPLSPFPRFLTDRQFDGIGGGEEGGKFLKPKTEMKSAFID